MLRSKDGLLELRLELSKPLEAEHRGWISYRMIFCRAGNTEFVFESTSDAPLFLDATIEPEVPTICAEIRNAIHNRTCFAYEPIDDRDFRLVVDAQDEFPLVSIQFADVSAPVDFRWTSGVEVTRTDLASFVARLETQHSDLTS
jgi:hypothetical protein